MEPSELFMIPKEILSGVVNVTHFVHLNRISKDLKLVPKTVLPQADNIIPDKSRNLIDSSFLSLMLTRDMTLEYRCVLKAKMSPLS